MSRIIGRAGVAGVALAVLLGSSGCGARERPAERGEPAQQVERPTRSGQPIERDTEDVTAGHGLAEIDALLAEIEADLRQTDLDVTTDGGDVQ